MREAGFEVAVGEARSGLAEGGIPIGAALVLDGEVLGRGRNLRVQKDSAIFHAEISALEDAGRRSHAEYRRATVYTTLTPCIMCAGAIVRAGIGRVVIGENRTVTGAEDLLANYGIAFEVLDDVECAAMMAEFTAREPEIWAEDGVSRPS